MAQVLGVIFGAMLILVGVLESFFIHKPGLRRLFLVAPEDVRTVRLWTFNLGFYNMVWGVVILLLV